ncbi:MAG: limonene-1,2-epoxide hydrolase family protein, partial [Pseudomonadales bacterium]
RGADLFPVCFVMIHLCSVVYSLQSVSITGGQDHNEKLVMDLFEAMKGPTLEDTISGFKQYCHQDVLWQNSGFPDIVGHEAMEHLLREQKRLFDFERVEVLEHRLLASDGDHVFFERRDTISNSMGKVIFAFDILGVFEIQKGQIVRWSDYMDTSEIRNTWEQGSFEKL